VYDRYRNIVGYIQDPMQIDVHHGMGRHLGRVNSSWLGLLGAALLLGLGLGGLDGYNY
jgi:hypothetical protein